MKMGLIKMVLFPYYIFLWMVKIVLWMAGVVFLGYFKVLFGPQRRRR